jgi:hypothetical protein
MAKNSFPHRVTYPKKEVNFNIRKTSGKEWPWVPWCKYTYIKRFCRKSREKDKMEEGRGKNGKSEIEE